MSRLNPKRLAKRRAIVEKLIAERKYEEALDYAAGRFLNERPYIQYTIAKTRLLREYQIKESQLDDLLCNELDNPYYRTGPPMCVFLIAEVREKFKLKPKWEQYYNSLADGQTK